MLLEVNGNPAPLFLEIFTFFFSITKICYRIKSMENVTGNSKCMGYFGCKKERKEHLMNDVR